MVGTMKFVPAIFFCCLAAATAGNKAVSGSGSPVERVVHLLEDLKSKIDMDGKAEQQTYDKYACWCEKTSARKAADITEAQNELRALGQAILTLKGEVATLAAEIAELERDIAANKEMQAEATRLREKENAAYQAGTTDMKEVLTALEMAIIVLKNGTSALLQEGTAGTAVKRVIQALPSTVSLKPDQISMLSEFATASGAAKYAPQSWTVQGILRDMYDTFSSDLETANLDEAEANRNYETLMHTKYLELVQLEKQKASKEAEKAEKETQLADTQTTFDDTEAQMKADIVFFDATKASCEAKHSEWTTRAALREEELEGITKALELLTTDEARELFGRSIAAGKEKHADSSYNTGVDITSPVLFQVGSQEQLAAPVASAYAALKAQASKAHSLRLAALAVQVHEAKVGHFDTVIAAIDTMITTLKDEDAADIAKRDQCKDEYQSIASRVANITWLIKNNEAKIDKLQSLIELRQEQRRQTIIQIAEVEQNIIDINATRTAENQVFLQEKADDQNSINLLVQAREFLASYYVNNSIGVGPIQAGVKELAFAQQGPSFDISSDQAPEAKFSDMGHRKYQTKDIVSIMTMIIEDQNEEIMNDMRDEEQAQLAYEKEFAAAQALRDQLIQKKINLEAMIAKRQQEKSEEEILLSNNQADRTDELQYKSRITPDCDWIIGAWEKRAADRAAEMSGLVGAKEYLAGYQEKSEAALLEKSKGRRKFDDNALSKIGFLGFKQ